MLDFHSEEEKNRSSQHCSVHTRGGNGNIQVYNFGLYSFVGLLSTSGGTICDEPIYQLKELHLLADLLQGPFRWKSKILPFHSNRSNVRLLSLVSTTTAAPSPNYTHLDRSFASILATTRKPGFKLLIDLIRSDPSASPPLQLPFKSDNKTDRSRTTTAREDRFAFTRERLFLCVLGTILGSIHIIVAHRCETHQRTQTQQL